MFKKSPIINVVTNILYDAAKFLKRDFNEIKYMKTDKADFLKKAREHVFCSIQRSLQVANPSYGYIFNGEIVRSTTQNFYWLIEPVDCSLNFMKNIGLWGMSVALVSKKNVESEKIDLDSIAVHNALFYCPILDELFVADAKGGVLFDSRKLSIKYDANDALIAGDFAICNRNFGSVLLNACYLCANRVDVVINTNDSFANTILASFFVNESSGVFVCKNNKIIATNSLLYEKYKTNI